MKKQADMRFNVRAVFHVVEPNSAPVVGCRLNLLIQRTQAILLNYRQLKVDHNAELTDNL